VTTTEAAPADLLAVARHLLARSGSGGDLASGVWPRSAAVLARQALEQSLTSLWRQKGLDLAAASARAQLLCREEYLGDPNVAADARFAWWALSRACHHHPYELVPTVAEIEGWVGSVERVVRAIDADAGAEGPA
jgi:hypothetical protein